MLAGMSKHAAPSLRLAEVPDRIAVLADAMRAFTDRPGLPEARRNLDLAMRGCTDDEYKAAWDMAQQTQAPAATVLPSAGPAPAAPPAPRPEVRPAALTRGQRVLAGFAAALGLGLAPMFFIVMFITVNELLGPYFSGWAWTVPIATETTFVLLTVLAVLFEWMRRPVPALWRLPYLFAGLSVFMNVWAYRSSPAGIAGHLAVTAAFFIPMGFAKTTVRKLIVTPAERARAASLADARAHAYDVLRAAFGVLWRIRTPVLLRRQLRSGRLPAAVLGAVGTCDAGVWEPAVQAWITAAVTLPGQVGKALRAAAAVPAAVTVTDTGADSAPDNVADNCVDRSPDSRADKDTDRLADKPRDNVPDISPDNRPTTRPSRRGQKAAPPDPVAAMVKRRPKWTDEQVAEACGVSTRTVKRRREALAQAAQASA